MKFCSECQVGDCITPASHRQDWYMGTSLVILDCYVCAAHLFTDADRVLAITGYRLDLVPLK